MIVIPIDKFSVQLIIDSGIYSESVIHKCFYWYGSRCQIDIEKQAEEFRITLADPAGKINLETVIAEIRRDLLDFQTREIITRETKDIRAILIAKAFANDDTLDEDASWTIQDPIGFDPKTFDPSPYGNFYEK